MAWTASCTNWTAGAMQQEFLANFMGKIDAKGRILVPSSFRAALGDEKTVHCMYSVAGDRAIDVFPAAHLKEKTEAFKAKYGVNSREYRQFQTVFKGGLFPITIDSDGRTILPDQLLRKAQINEHAVFVGSGDYFQIWEPGVFEAYQEQAIHGTQEAMFGPVTRNGRSD